MNRNPQLNPRDAPSTQFQGSSKYPSPDSNICYTSRDPKQIISVNAMLTKIYALILRIFLSAISSSS